ncbi:MFS transporter [Geochorda subterranea]|uniref:MFS transporter n=1 Tax=Geochorda subterranea TaxID=3109564 RepID=A0ABZ1BPC1_9FIRM|nr:MFS transporter [Limnochorda sp. LNt]WRP14406.1 MFS transporter [Limnochorda sp. LNt]
MSTRAGRLNHVTSALGIGRLDEMPAVVPVLALGGLVFTFGSSFVWPVTTIYIHFVLGRSLAMAGLVLMLSSSSSLAGQLAGGAAFDRWGGRRVLLVGLLLRAAAQTVIALVPLWPVYVAAMMLDGWSYGLVDPATNALVSRAWPEGGRRGFNFLYVARNAGVALGTAFGGLVAGYSFTAAFLANAAASLAYAVMVWRRVPAHLPEPVTTRRAPSPDSPAAAEVRALALGTHPAVSGRWPLAAMGALVVGVGLVWMAYGQWQAVISVYMQELGYPLASYSVLWTLNGVLIVGSQPLVGWVTRRGLSSVTAQMLVGTALFAASFVLVWRWPLYPGFVLGMVVLTLGEVLAFPAFPAAAAVLAPPARQGFFQGLVGGAVSAGRMLGPLAGGALYDRLSPPVVLGAAAVVSATACACFDLYRALARRAGTGAGRRSAR